MNDHVSDDQLEALVEETLLPAERLLVEAHLDECESCLGRLALRAEALAERVAAKGSIDQITHKDFNRELLSRIHETVNAHVATPPGNEASVSTHLRLIKTVGQGGLGHVFEYADTKFDRAVAIKILQDRWSTDPNYVERFRREMELTAAIDHPGCPAVYGSGITTDGRDFFWMQLVTGPTLDEVLANFHASDDKRLDRTNVEFRKLLDIFRDICETIAAAHRRGILHRDLKPQNVRVHRDGHPVVLDWGLAKRCDTDDNEEKTSSNNNAPELTRQGRQLGTPLYMSPEQARGDLDAFNHQTDVYGLGGILHEILTGIPPHETLAKTVNDTSDLTDAIGHGSVPKLVGVLAELASICGKALAPEQPQRYSAATELAADIERWLAGDVVREHRYGVTGRVALAIRRQPMAFAAGMIAALVVVAASLLTSRLMAATEVERETTKEWFQLAFETQKSLIMDVQEELHSVGGTGKAREKLLERGINGINQLLKKAENQPGTELVALQARFELAGLERRERGDLAKARQIYESAIDDLRVLRPSSADQLQHRKLLLDVLKGAAFCTYDMRGISEARPLFDEWFEEAELFRKLFPNDNISARALAQSQIVRGRLAEDRGPEGLPEAIRSFKVARATLAAVTSPLAEEPNHQYELTVVMSELARVLSETGELEEAIRLQKESLEMSSRLVKNHPERHYRVGLIEDEMNLARYLKRKGDADAAIKQFLKAQGHAESLAKNFPDDENIQSLNSDVRHNLATAYRAAGKPDLAIEMLLPLVAVPGDFDNETAHIAELIDQAITHSAVAHAYKDAKKDAKAYGHYRAILRLRRSVSNRDPELLENKREMLIAASECGQLAKAADKVEATRTLLYEMCENLDGNSEADAWPPSIREQLASVYNFLGGLQLNAVETDENPEAAGRAKLSYERSRALLASLKNPPIRKLEGLERQIEFCERIQGLEL